MASRARLAYGRWTPFWFLAPSVLALLLIGIYPTLFALVTSLRQYNLARAREGFPFVGLANYVSVLTDVSFWQTLGRTGLFFICVMPAEVGLGLLVALLLHQTQNPLLRAVTRVSLVIPLATTYAVVGLLGRLIFNRDFGIVDAALQAIGIAPVDWLGSPSGAFAAICMMDVWQWTPFCALIFLSGLSIVPVDIEEAARLETTSRWALLREVQLPYLRPGLTAMLILRSADVLKLFDTVYNHDTRRSRLIHRTHLHLHPAYRLSRVRHRRRLGAGAAAARDHDRAQPYLHPPYLQGSRLMRRLLHALALLLVLAVTLFPFLWMVFSSFKTQSDLLASPPVWWFRPTLENYAQVFADPRVLHAVGNSLVIAVCSTGLAVLLGAPAAFALARFEFRGKSDLWFWFISNRFISPIVLALPIYILARDAHMLDTRIVLILVYITFILPIVIWIATDQFRSIPRDLEEAARLEGASQLTIFLKIYLPLGLPGIAVAAIFGFIFSWNELLYALVLTRRFAETAPVVATSFMSGYELPWGKIMATGTVIVLPVTIFALLVSRHMVRGLTMGATK